MAKNLFETVENIADKSTTYAQKKEQIRKLEEKWQKATGLLKGIEGKRRGDFAIVLESQAKRLVSESNTVGGMQGRDSYFNYALPLVRRTWDNLNSLEFMATQPLTVPTSLIFYLDVKYGDASSNAGKNSMFKPGTSIYGFQTGPNYDLTTEVPDGGLYGAGKFGFSLQYSATDAANGTVANLGTGTADVLTKANIEYIDFNATIQNEYVVANTGTEGAPVYKANYKTITYAIPAGIRKNINTANAQAFMLTGVDNLNILPRFTKIAADKSTVTFVAKYAGAIGTLAALVLNYVVTPAQLDGNATYPNDRAPYEDKTNANQGFYGSEVLDIADLSFDIYSKQIQAIGRKLKAKYTPELLTDMNAYHAVDAEAIITKICADHIATEIDLSNIALIAEAARNSGLIQYWSARPGYTFNKVTREFVKAADTTTVIGSSLIDWYRTLGIKLTDLSNTVNQRCGFGGINWIICSPKVATLVQSMPGFNGSGSLTNAMVGVNKVGMLDNTWKVFVNKHQTDNVVICGGAASDDDLTAGAIFSPYVMTESTPQIFDANGSIRRILSTRYATTIVRPEAYALMIIDGLETI